MSPFVGVFLIVFLVPALLQGAAQVEQTAAENVAKEEPNTALSPTQAEPQSPQNQS